MKKYWKEALALALQLYMFYIFPLFCGPTDAMGMVLLIFCTAFLFGAFLGAASGNKLKYAWPLAVALLFLPSIPIWYNSSALIHSVWHMVSSAIGLALGCLVRFLVRLFFGKKK